jgi:XTP/dITP diphosphohydrolase
MIHSPFIAQDSWRGRINNKYEGTNGFGYDPIFFLPDRNITSAELKSNDKH